MNHQPRDVYILNQRSSPTLFEHILRNIKHELTHASLGVSNHLWHILCEMGKLKRILVLTYGHVLHVNESPKLNLPHFKY